MIRLNVQMIAAVGQSGQIGIAGGRYAYASFLPFCRTIRLTRIAWNGMADTMMPPLWEGAEHGRGGA